ncbi:MAG: hypothetical protein R2912_10415 [Eubacteriales bacterium]
MKQTISSAHSPKIETEGHRCAAGHEDRDALRLISERTHVLMTKKGISETIRYGRDVLKEQYGLEPDRMRDLKGLMGDNSDNIPSQALAKKPP